MIYTLGYILKTIREENKISRTELASKLNISYSALQHWENDRRDINLFTLSSILDLLNSKLILNNNYITIEDFTSNKKYELDCFKKSDIEFLYKYNQYGIIKNYDINKKTTYSIVHINTLTTPDLLKLNYCSLVDTKLDLHKYIDNIKFPILSELTINTSGKLIFREQISKLLSRLGLENSAEIIKDIGKKKINDSIFKIKEKCILNHGEINGLELFEIIIEAISKCYKKVLFDDIVKGYEAFLNAITTSTNGCLKNIHQKHAVLKMLDTDNKYNCSYLSSYEEYDNAILNIINEDVYKYGYPSFYENIVISIEKSKI